MVLGSPFVHCGASGVGLMNLTVRREPDPCSPGAADLEFLRPRPCHVSGSGQVACGVTRICHRKLDYPVLS
jgi:hypothetical protein